jgi:hypothetical protein
VYRHRVAANASESASRARSTSAPCRTTLDLSQRGVS